MNSQINILKYLTIYVFCLFSITSIGQITTVVPALENSEETLLLTDSSSTLSFVLSAIPLTAKIKTCSLHITLSEDVSDKMILDTKISGSRFGYYYVDRSFKSNRQFVIDGTIDLLKRIETKKIPDTINMELMTRNEGNNNKISVFGKGNQSPRLVITYELIPEPSTDWAMPYANAQHGGNTFMRFGGDVSGVFKPQMSLPFNTIQKDFVIHKDKVITIDYRDNKTSLYAVNPITKSKTPIVQSGMVASTIPVIDRFGNLYYSSENNIEVINLENSSYRKRISIGNLKNVTTFPTIGPDGSFYLVLNSPTQSGSEIYAYSPDPLNALLWKKTLNGKVSALSFNKKGTIAYVASFKEKKFIAINPINGDTIKESDSISLESPTNTGFTVPLVTDNGYIFITNKLIDANKMYVFDSNLELKKTIEGDNISRAVSGSNNNVFFVKDGLLHNYLAEEQISLKGTIRLFTDKIAIRSLVADKSNNVYCLGTDKKLYSYYGTEKSKKVITSEEYKDDFDKAMVISRDGTLYTATSKELIAFKFFPSTDYTLTEADNQQNDLTIKGNNITAPEDYILNKNQILVGSNHVQFLKNVVLAAEGNILIESGKTISFKSGFNVKKGAKLTCRIGY